MSSSEDITATPVATPAAVQKPKRTRKPVSADVKHELTEWFDKHREDIRYAKKGYIARVKAAFEEESSHSLTDSQFRKILEVFRLTHNCPIEYVQNK